MAAHWGFSADRPVAVQSAMVPLKDIQTRLNFSSVNSPSSAPKKRPLINISRTPKTPSPQRTMNNLNSRLADYHMSKQNPDMLDRVNSPLANNRHTLAANYASAQYQYLGFNSTGSSPYNRSPNSNGVSPYHFSGLNSTGSSPYRSLGSNSFTTHSPSQQSLLKQSLQASKAQSQARSSLVNLATQRSVMKINATPMSPGIVRLSRGATTANGTRESASPAPSEPDPCDKDTVLSALRSKRKRWSSSQQEGGVTVQPSAKKSRPTPSSPAIEPLPSNRKRAPDPVPAANESKRTKIIKPVARKINRIVLPVIEYEQQTVIAESPTVTEPVSSPPLVEREQPAAVIENLDKSKERDESLSLLRTVYPTDSPKKSLRREVPVFCATGVAPNMPAPLPSNGYTLTREDLIKEREARAAKVDLFLSAPSEETDSKEDDQPSVQPLSVSTSSTSQPEAASSVHVSLAVSQPLISTIANSQPLVTSSLLTGSITAVPSLSTLSSGGPVLNTSLALQPLNGTASLNAVSITPATNSTSTVSLSSGLQLKTAPQMNSQTPVLQFNSTAESTGLKLNAASSQPSGMQLGATPGSNLSSGSQPAALQPSNATQLTGLKLSTTQSGGFQLNSAPQSSGLNPSNSTQSLSFNLGSTAQSSGFNLSTTTQSIGLNLATTSQSGGLHLTTTTPSTGFSLGNVSQLGAVQLGTVANSPGLKLNSTSQPSGFLLSSAPQSSGLKISTTVQSSGLKLNTATQSAGLQLNTTTQSGLQSTGMPGFQSKGLFQTAPANPSPLQNSLKSALATTSSQSASSSAPTTCQAASGFPSLAFGSQSSTQQGTGQLSNGGIKFGAQGASQKPNEQLNNGGLKLQFGAQTAPQQNSGSLGNVKMNFGSQNASNQPSSGLLSNGGLKFGTQSTEQQNDPQVNNGSLKFGIQSMGQQSSGFAFGSQNPNNGSLFSSQPSGSSSIFSSNNKPNPPTSNVATSSSSGFNFSAALGSQNSVSLFGQKTSSQNLANGSSQGFSFTGNKTLSFGASKEPSTSSSSLFSSTSKTSGSLFGTTTQSAAASSFSFTGSQANSNNSSQTGFNFGSTQNNTGGSTFSFGASNNTAASSVFNSPQPGFTTPNTGSNGLQFTPQQGSAFPAGQRGLNFNATPTANPFPPATPTGSSNRSTARTRRRRGKR